MDPAKAAGRTFLAAGIAHLARPALCLRGDVWLDGDAAASLRDRPITFLLRTHCSKDHRVYTHTGLDLFNEGSVVLSQKPQWKHPLTSLTLQLEFTFSCRICFDQTGMIERLNHP